VQVELEESLGRVEAETSDGVMVLAVLLRLLLLLV
jgi:hypothetical protein